MDKYPVLHNRSYYIRTKIFRSSLAFFPAVAFLSGCIPAEVLVRLCNPLIKYQLGWWDSTLAFVFLLEIFLFTGGPVCV